MTYEFNSPMLKEDWDKLQDNEMEDTYEIIFTTPSGKRVPFKKVKQGKWEKVRSANYGTDFRCSECHRYRFHNGEMRKEYKYCPHCGADMRGKTNG